MDEHTLDLLALDIAREWLFLRLEIHPFLKGRLPIGSAECLPVKKLVQLHAILDKVDHDKAESMAELEKNLRRGK